ncbi:BspA family leucine-rich repeat surface protein [bacterium]|nr:BspA family leucine-rich repeat surface protein [bacterium]
MDASKVTDLNQIFYGLGNVITLDLSNWDTRNVTNMNNMFWVCDNIETIYASS